MYGEPKCDGCSATVSAMAGVHISDGCEQSTATRSTEASQALLVLYFVYGARSTYFM